MGKGKLKMSEISIRKKRCEICHYGKVEKLKIGESTSDLKVKCLKRSPAIDWNTNTGIFPTLSAYAWCGQYRERKEVEMENVEV